MDKKNQKKLIVIGILLLIMGIADFAYTIFFEPLYNLLWFSNSITILVGLAIISRNRLFMGAMLISSMIEIPWVVDFLSHLLFGVGVFGNATEYMFRDFGFNSLNFYLELNHVLVIPAAVYGALKIGIHKKSYFVSGAQAALFSILAFYLAPASKNINCVYHLCSFKEDIFGINNSFYLVVWISFLFIMGYLLNRAFLNFLKHE